MEVVQELLVFIVSVGLAATPCVGRFCVAEDVERDVVRVEHARNGERRGIDFCTTNQPVREGGGEGEGDTSTGGFVCRTFPLVGEDSERDRVGLHRVWYGECGGVGRFLRG